MPEHLRGVGVAGGVALGRVLRLDLEPAMAARESIETDEVEGELLRLRAARTRVHGELADLRQRVGAALGASFAGMIDAESVILDDPELWRALESGIEVRRLSADEALRRAIESYAARFAQVEDGYFRERGGDLHDVHRRLQRALDGTPVGTATADEGPRVAVARSLGPGDVVSLARSGIVGLATDLGGRTSHVAIVAQALGVPAVVALRDVSRRARSDETILVDADAGEVILRPDPQLVERAIRRQGEWRRRTEERGPDPQLPAITEDGVEIVLRANVEFLEEVEPAIRAGAQGVGLFRSEFLLLGTPPGQWPGEEEQLEIYRELARRVSPYPAVIRTFDRTEGGDDASLLGTRGVRLWLDRPPWMRPQIRALLRAGVHGDVRVLIPFVTRVEEVLEVRERMAEEASALTAEGIEHRADLPLGIMIEVPAAALTADLLAREADFFSLGTNDLIQYATAVARSGGGNVRPAGSRDPAVLRLIRYTLDAASARQVPVSLCGEMASDPAMAEVLVGLGLRELSVPPSALPALRRQLPSIHSEKARAAAAAALAGA